METEKNKNADANDVQIGLMPKDGDKLMEALEQGHMAALLSKGEILYAFVDTHYQCYIHPIGAEEGRCKRFEKTEKSRAIIKNLAGLADQMFEITFGDDMQFLGVMVAAERGIVDYLDLTGQLPGADHDFMDGMDSD